MQLLPSGVRVMVAYPPDTDTPGYAKENLSKVQQFCEMTSFLLLTEAVEPWRWHGCSQLLPGL